MAETASRWYQDAIVYEVHVKSFYDANGDGIGDFPGLAQRLDYLQDLGITAIWLLPFYPSPFRDDGYDISDYRNIHPSYGLMRDFRHFVREAHRRGIRVITELVINHTSDQHPWFQRARRAKPGSTWRNFYVWSDSDQKYVGTRIIFVDAETSNWAWDPEAKAYYWHRFYSHQPDLNFDNPRVLSEVIRIMRYWLDMGVDGLRMDAIPYLCERDGTNNENLAETHQIIKHIRAEIDRHYPARVLLAEANQWPEDVRPYFGDGDECHMAFHFPLMPRIYMALAQEDRHPITDIMRQTPGIPDGCQWAIFLRNHDELTLEMVTDRERDYLWSRYAVDAHARHNLGIRRRLAPLMENDRRKIELLNSLLMSMPGTPVLYYGDEVGMGDNIYLGDRNGVRTPMQWSPDRNAGFSRADPARLYLPPNMDPVYGYEAVNVEAQSRSPTSLLNWMKGLIAARKRYASFGRGTLTFLYPGNRKVLAYLRQLDSETVLCVANLARAPQPVMLDLVAFRGRVPVELLGRSAFPPIGDLPYFITLPAYGFYWFVLAEAAAAPDWHEPQITPPPELMTFVILQGWASLLTEDQRTTLEERVLREHIAARRWFGAKDEKIAGVTFSSLGEIPFDRASALFGVVSIALGDGRRRQLYAFPLSITWEDAGEGRLAAVTPYIVARVRRGPKPGILHSAIADDDFIRAVVAAIKENRELPGPDGGRLVFRPTGSFPAALDHAALPIQRTTREQSNTSVRIGDAMVLKFYRQLQAGTHPEIEVGLHLTDVASYHNSPPILGWVAHVDAAGSETALAALMAYVWNQGDAWTLTHEYVRRFLEEVDLLAPAALGTAHERHKAFLSMAHLLGRRVAELHRALATANADRAFAPQRIGPRDIHQWHKDVLRQARLALATAARVRKSLGADERELAQRFLTARRALAAKIKSLVPDAVGAAKTRCHGDLHLGQVLVVKDDFQIIDFEGEPARPLAERRIKHCPLRDVAGILRSIDYVASLALRERASVRPESRQTLVPWIEDWVRCTKDAFRSGYRETIGDCPSYPDDEAVVDKLIGLFSIEKALYELCYEAANRPDWIHIPLVGILALIDRGPQALHDEGR